MANCQQIRAIMTCVIVAINKSNLPKRYKKIPDLRPGVFYHIQFFSFTSVSLAVEP